jgi:hypothetical protein
LLGSVNNVEKLFCKLPSRLPMSVLDPGVPSTPSIAWSAVWVV